MGKLKDLLDRYKTCPRGSPEEQEVRDEIFKIVEWMKENGHITKPFKLPAKDKRMYYGVSIERPTDDKPTGFYCPHCLTRPLTEEQRKQNKCPDCGWGLGVVIYHFSAKDLLNKEDLK